MIDKYFGVDWSRLHFTELTYSVPQPLEESECLVIWPTLFKGAELLPQVKKVPVRIARMMRVSLKAAFP